MLSYVSGLKSINNYNHVGLEALFMPQFLYIETAIPMRFYIYSKQ